MYYYIKGTLVQKSDNYIVVDANGVGYIDLHFAKQYAKCR